MQVTPRAYQVAAVKAAIKGLRSRWKKALVVLATGLGKTLTAAFIAKKICAKRVLFLVHNNFILEHAISEFRLVFDEKTKMATYNSMSKDGASTADIVFATWQTMGRNLKEWKRNCFDLIIVDEAHHSEAETYKPVTQYFTGPRLGITATPDRADDTDIRNIFDAEVINITLEEAIARGWLPRIEYHVITDESLDDSALQKIAQEIRQSKKRFTMAEVNRRIFIKKRDVEITKIINGYNEKAIVFCASIRHANRLSESLALCDIFHSKAGISQIDSWQKNQTALEALKNGVIRRVCAVNAFNEGVNVPSVGLVAFCRVTDSITIFRQQLGRGLRPGKDKLIVLDFVGNLERIQLVLEMMNEISDLHEKFTSKSERGREGYTRQRFEVSGKGFEFTFSDKVVDLMEVLKHCQEDFYETWQEAGSAAQRLGIISFVDYHNRYKEDSCLPSTPNDIYPDFPGWEKFLNTGFYETWQEAGSAAQRLGIISSADYRNRYKEDSCLPSNPNATYPDFPGWGVFLNTGRTRRTGNSVYKTWRQAAFAAQALGISKVYDYKARYKEDPHLQSHPDCAYPDFPGWGTFLGTGIKLRRRKNVYKSWKEASSTAQRLGIISFVDYRNRYKEDSCLPSNPDQTYLDFPGWEKFLNTGFYETWQEAGSAAQRLGITGRRDYLTRYKKDSRLASSPNTVYTNFPGWKKFLGKK